MAAIAEWKPIGISVAEVKVFRTSLLEVLK